MATIEKHALLVIRFDRGVVCYLPDFSVCVEGLVWPRQLKAASDIVERYKLNSKLDSLDAKVHTTGRAAAGATAEGDTNE